jgi:hypothetical protein
MIRFVMSGEGSPEPCADDVTAKRRKIDSMIKIRINETNLLLLDQNRFFFFPVQSKNHSSSGILKITYL